MYIMEIILMKFTGNHPTDKQRDESYRLKWTSIA